MSEHSRLRWRCRRGTTELDRLLTRFIEAESDGYYSLDATGRERFEQLLDTEDDQLIDWLVNGQPPREDELADVVQSVRAASGLCD